MFFLLSFERNLCLFYVSFLWKHNAKARFETKDSNSLITSLCIEYIGEFMTDPMILFDYYFYKLTTQLIKFNIPKNDWISLPALGGTDVVFSCIVNLIIYG